MEVHKGSTRRSRGPARWPRRPRPRALAESEKTVKMFRLQVLHVAWTRHVARDCQDGRGITQPLGRVRNFHSCIKVQDISSDTGHLSLSSPFHSISDNVYQTTSSCITNSLSMLDFVKVFFSFSYLLIFPCRSRPVKEWSSHWLLLTKTRVKE